MGSSAALDLEGAVLADDSAAARVVLAGAAGATLSFCGASEAAGLAEDGLGAGLSSGPPNRDAIWFDPPPIASTGVN